MLVARESKKKKKVRMTWRYSYVIWIISMLEFSRISLWIFVDLTNKPKSRPSAELKQMDSNCNEEGKNGKRKVDTQNPSDEW